MDTTCFRNKVRCSLRQTLWTLLALGVGCTDLAPPDDDQGTNGQVTRALASTAENADTVNAALEAAEDLLAEGETLEAARDALLARLQTDPQVLGAALDPDSGAVFADFRSGETQIFSLIDTTSDPEGSVVALRDAALTARVAALPALPAGKPGAAQGTGLDTYWRMPASNRALLVNGIEALHPDKPYTNSAPTISKMLADRGYDVETPESLTVDHFTHLTDYGLIVIEAHGLWREPSWPTELLFPSATCGGTGSKQALLTTTVVTNENTIAYAGDMGCGRLMAWNTSFRDPNNPRRRLQTWAVTPNFVREHDPGTFPSNTVMYLNSCRGYDQNFVSPYEQLLFEKCGSGAMFMGWSQRVDYAYAGRALVNLFQLATCSNELLVIDDVNVLQQSTPPQGNFASLRMAWGQLNARGWTFDPVTLGQLLYTDQQQDYRDMVVMPHFIDFLSTVDAADRNEYKASLWSAGVAPALRIGSNFVTLQRENQGLFTVYRIAGSSPAHYGTMQLSEQDRTDAPSVLHRWRPSISITNVGGDLKYQITLTLHARAARANGRTSAWLDPPAAAFGETAWDKPACWVAWNVSGEKTYNSDLGPMRAVYSGSGSRAFTASDHGWLRCSEDGTTVNFDATAYITYTTTTTNLNTGDISTYDTTASAHAEAQGLGLTQEWTIAGGSYSSSSATLGNFAVTWNAVAAEPPFDPTTEPR